jgi:hypothetical protein
MKMTFGGSDADWRSTAVLPTPSMPPVYVSRHQFPVGEEHDSPRSMISK